MSKEIASQAESQENNHDQKGPFTPSDLHCVYQALMQSRIDYSVRKWETVKTSTILSTGALAAVGGIAAAKGTPAFPTFIILGLILIIVGLVQYDWSIRNLRRESQLQYFDEFPMYQIEKLMGLHEPLPANQRWYHKSPYFFGKKHRFWNYQGPPARNNDDPVKNWVDKQMESYEFLNVVRYFNGLILVILVIIGLVLIGLSFYDLLKGDVEGVNKAAAVDGRALVFWFSWYRHKSCLKSAG